LGGARLHPKPPTPERAPVTADVAWTGGGEASVVSCDADSIVLRSTVPSPPGSRIEGELVGLPSARLRVKVHACRRQAEGDFLLQGRPLDMTRDVRMRVEGLVASRV
jgi:hypothetical protein